MKRILIVFIVLLTLNSCDKEKGCTNANSDNFSASVTQDDGSCVLSRKKFFGTWIWDFAQILIINKTEVPVAGTEMQGTFTIEASNLNEAGVNVSFNTLNPEFKDVLYGVVSKNTITFSNQVINGNTYNGTIDFLDSKLKLNINLSNISKLYSGSAHK
jgi:hypothetical protein